ncbi:hypothetical protein HYT56_05525 [Candidatus Woesearchaeota archaeon]|nr:hypothetical protein [Candidatus Woesearchaeota archaeon]
MVSITIQMDDKLRSEIDNFSWVNWSELAREEISRKEVILDLIDKLNSKEEQELIKWSVELGKKAKSGRFKQLLSELSAKEREELLK